MKKLLLVASLCVVFLSACGAVRSKQEWKKAEQVNPLEIPPGLNDPGLDSGAALPPTQPAANDESHPEMAPLPGNDEEATPAGSDDGQMPAPPPGSPVPDAGGVPQVPAPGQPPL